MAHEMWWDCESHGCFKKKKVLKFSVFDDCFEGKKSFSDIDAIIEINNNYLLMEWKDPSVTKVPIGQEIMFKRMTQDKKYTVLVVYGDAEDMSVTGIQIFKNGQLSQAMRINLDDLKKAVRSWVKESEK